MLRLGGQRRQLDRLHLFISDDYRSGRNGNSGAGLSRQSRDRGGRPMYRSTIDAARRLGASPDAAADLSGSQRARPCESYN